MAILDREPLWIHLHDSFETRRNRCFNIFERKLDERTGTMKTFLPDRLLLRGKFKLMLERIAHVDAAFSFAHFGW